MKKLEINSYVSTSNAFPIKSGTLDFLQQANSEIFDLIAKLIISPSYDTTKGYVFFGNINTGSNNISAGGIFLNGEFFLTDAVSLGTLTLQFIGGNLDTTQYTTNADPVQFSGGGLAVNVHNVRKIKWSKVSVLSTALIRFDELIFLNSYLTVSAAATYTQIGATTGPTFTLNFTTNTILNNITTGVGVNTFDCINTNAIPGMTCIIQGSFTSGASIAFSASSGGSVLKKYVFGTLAPLTSSGTYSIEILCVSSSIFTVSIYKNS